MSTIKPWRQVAMPYADICSGKFDASVSAADLGEVLAGRRAIDYRDATTFFSKTYLTEGITKLLIDVMQRLSGSGRTDPVIQLQTAFGGGKTHTLLTIYHLLKKLVEVGKLSPVKNLLAAAGLKEIHRAKVACLVGTALHPTTHRTFWGEMACQTGPANRSTSRSLSSMNRRSPRHGPLGRHAPGGGAVRGHARRDPRLSYQGRRCAGRRRVRSQNAVMLH